FSSRRRHTRSKRDWSSDVCSSDLAAFVAWLEGDKHHPAVHSRTACKAGDIIHCRIVTDNFHEILQLTAHRLKRNTLIRLNPAHHHASVLLREEGGSEEHTSELQSRFDIVCR